MTIEVRQIIVRSTVGDAASASTAAGEEAPPPGLSPQQLERLLARTQRELLAQCRAMLEERLARPGER